MCRYPLIFAELLKHTPVDDCANSHMEVENTLIRLREATAEINRATDDTRMRTVLEKTWVLQDRLVFANQVRSHNGDEPGSSLISTLIAPAGVAAMLTWRRD